MKHVPYSRIVAHRALSISDPANRVDYLDRACGDDQILRRELEALLPTEETAGLKSARFTVTGRDGLGAIEAAPIVRFSALLFPDWEIIIAKDGERVDAKSIMGIMMLAAEQGTQVEFFSLMPLKAWRTYTGILGALCWCNKGEKCDRQEETLRGERDPEDLLERLNDLAREYHEKDRLLEPIPQPDKRIWSETDLSIVRQLQNHKVVGSPTPSGDGGSELGWVILVITVLAVFVTLIGLGVWKVIELVF